MTDDPLGPKRLIQALAIIFVAVLVVWVLYAARYAVLLIYISALLAIGLAPLVRLIERLEMLPVAAERLPRWLAILILYLAFVGLVVVLGLVIVPPVLEQAAEFWDALPRYLTALQDWLLQRGLLSRRVTLSEAVPQAGSDAVSTVLNTAWGLAGGLLGTVTVLIMTFYLLVDAVRIRRTVISVAPGDRRAQAIEVSAEVASKVSAWLVGHLVLAAVVGGATAIGLAIIGVPFAWVIAVLAAAAEMVPIIGPLIAGTVAVLVAMTVSTQTALITLAFVLVLQILESNVLVPKVMERQIGLSPVVVVAALLIGSELRGVIGAILAVPTAAIVMVVIEELSER